MRSVIEYRFAEGNAVIDMKFELIDASIWTAPWQVDLLSITAIYPAQWLNTSTAHALAVTAMSASSSVKREATPSYRRSMLFALRLANSEPPAALSEQLPSR